MFLVHRDPITNMMSKLHTVCVKVKSKRTRIGKRMGFQRGTNGNWLQLVRSCALLLTIKYSLILGFKTDDSGNTRLSAIMRVEYVNTRVVEFRGGNL